MCWEYGWWRVFLFYLWYLIVVGFVVLLCLWRGDRNFYGWEWWWECWYFWSDWRFGLGSWVGWWLVVCWYYLLEVWWDLSSIYFNGVVIVGWNFYLFGSDMGYRVFLEYCLFMLVIVVWRWVRGCCCFYRVVDSYWWGGRFFFLKFWLFVLWLVGDHCFWWTWGCV